MRANHHRWDVKTGAKVKAAEAAAIGVDGAGGDALDQLVEIQKARQARLKSLNSAPPVVQRLYAGMPPPTPPPLNPLDDFAAFVRAQAAANVQATAKAAAAAAAPPRRVVAREQNKVIATRTGLHFA